MQHIVGVFGEWVVDKEKRQFIVNQEKGGKLFKIGLKFEELIHKVCQDFGIDRLVQELELCYVLPDTMLQNMSKDTPPIFVSYDGQLETLWEMCSSMNVRLCISLKNVNVEPEDHVLISRKIPVVSGKVNDENSTNNSFEGARKEYINDDLEVGFSNFNDRKVIEKGQWFKNKADLDWSIRMLAIERKFRISVSKSDTKLLVVKCKDKSCKWMVRASKKKTSCEFFWVTKYIDKHSCGLIRSVCAPLASSKIIGRLLLENFGNAGINMKPELISMNMKKRYGVDSKYWKIWKAREKAREMLLGSPEGTYAKLPVYIQKIQTANPGTIACLEVDDQQRFKYLFISFGASARGYEFMRKVVVVDGTFLKGKFNGVLLVATAQDGDSHAYPLAFGIVDSENDASWEWFFRNLKSVVPDEPQLVMISDRHASIAKGIAKVYPLAHRGICTYHLQKNVITKFRGKKFVRLVKTASRAYTVAEFNEIFDEIRRQNQNLSIYLEEANIQLWSRAYFPGDKYNITTSNNAESINAVFKKPRELPIVSLLEVIRKTLTRWFFDRRQKAANVSTSVTPTVAKEIKKRSNLSDTFEVQPINLHEFQVIDGSRIYVVDLHGMTCTCRVFDIEKIPCTHAARAAISRGIDPVLLSHPYYTKSHWYAAYMESIRPIDDLSDLSQIPSEIVGQLCLPPNVRRSAGRPKKRRYEGILEQTMRKKSRRQQNCSTCHHSGHNRATCDFGV